MGDLAAIDEARRDYHAVLLEKVLLRDENGVLSNADITRPGTIAVADAIFKRLSPKVTGARLASRSVSKEFEAATYGFLAQIFVKFSQLPPDSLSVQRVTGEGENPLAGIGEYEHLWPLKQTALIDTQLAATLADGNMITPDIVIVRRGESDEQINHPRLLVDDSVAQRASLRLKNGGMPLLHASISCKWTLRSDRAQNARSEALNLIRNRKGRLPHIVVVTGEPSPSRLASLAIGTGDIDCVYHFALHELLESVEEAGSDEAKDLMAIMTEGKRLRDISDLPLDLAV